MGKASKNSKARRSGISKQRFTILLLAGCVALIFGIKWISQISNTGISESLIGPRAKGNPKAELHIVEYIDFQCPSCANGSRIISNFFKQYPDRIFLEMKYFPLGMHKHALKSARYAQCAARQGKFWPFHDLLIQRQRQWKRLTNAEPAFGVMAKDVELNQKELDACLKEEEVTEFVMKDKAEGQSLGVKSTPTYFLNKKMVVGSKSLNKELKAYFGKENK